MYCTIRAFQLWLCAFDVPSAETPTRRGNGCLTGGAMDSPSIRAVRFPGWGPTSNQSVVTLRSENGSETGEPFISSLVSLKPAIWIWLGCAPCSDIPKYPKKVSKGSVIMFHEASVRVFLLMGRGFRNLVHNPSRNLGKSTGLFQEVSHIVTPCDSNVHRVSFFIVLNGQCSNDNWSLGLNSTKEFHWLWDCLLVETSWNPETFSILQFSSGSWGCKDHPWRSQFLCQPRRWCYEATIVSLTTTSPFFRCLVAVFDRLQMLVKQKIANLNIDATLTHTHMNDIQWDHISSYVMYTVWSKPLRRSQSLTSTSNRDQQ